MNIKKFNEVNLNFKELGKKTKSGETRGQKLVDRLKGDQNFTIVTKNKPEKQVNFENTDEIIDNITSSSDKFDELKAKNYLVKGKKYSKVFVGDDEYTYKLNDIKKDEYFGSSGGSSLGIQKTRIVESLQCIFLALKQLYPMKTLSEEDVDLLFDTLGNLDKKIINHVRIPIGIDEQFIRDFLESDDKNWIQTFINTANILTDKKLILSGENDYTIFRKFRRYNYHQIGCNSELIKAINLVYNTLETAGIPISKWCPSDVWAVEENSETRIINKIISCKKIEQLNKLINELFLEKKLIGISLKKIGKLERVDLIVNKLTPTPRYKFGGVITSDNPFGSMGLKLIGNYKSEIAEGKDEIYLRSFQGKDEISNISGEVSGASSRYGKIGLETINYILSSMGVLNDDLIPTKKQILKNESFNEYFLRSEIIHMNKLIKLKSRTITKPDSEGMGSLISKYQALRFGILMQDLSEGDNILKMEGRTPIVDSITESIFYYALSIQNFSFSSPMYVRIVTSK